MDGRKILAVRTERGLELPNGTLGGHSKALDSSAQSICIAIAEHTGVQVGDLLQKSMITIPMTTDALGNFSPVEVVVWLAKVVGASVPSVPMADIWPVEWVDVINPHEWNRWESVRPIFEELELWEAPAEDRVVAVVFGSWVCSIGHKTPQRLFVDVAVGYSGIVPPTRETMQRVGEAKVRGWLEGSGRSGGYGIQVHHGMQKVGMGKRVTTVEFELPERITLADDRVKVQENSKSRGYVRFINATTTGELPASVDKVIPWAFGQTALSLSTLLLSAFTDDELIMMWRARPVPIIVRLDDDEGGPLKFAHGFGLSNLHNAIRHSKEVGAFENAMRWVPWGQLISVLATKTPSAAFVQAFANEHCSGMVLLDDGVVPIPRSMVVRSARIQNEQEIRSEANIKAIGPVPYHVICREIFKKKLER